MNKWELFSHDADIGIRGIGDTLEQAFEMAGIALTAVVVDPQFVPAYQMIECKIEEEDVDFLFYEWINHLIYKMDTQKMLFKTFEVKIANHTLYAKIQGATVENFRGEFSVEIKGATLTELKVIKENENWIAQCVVNI